MHNHHPYQQRDDFQPHHNSGSQGLPPNLTLRQPEDVVIEKHKGAVKRKGQIHSHIQIPMLRLATIQLSTCPEEDPMIPAEVKL